MSAALAAALALRRSGRGAAWSAAQWARFSSASSSAPSALEAKVDQELAGIKAAGTFKVERVITTPQAASIGEG